MRVTSRSRSRRDERGAVLILVAVFAVVAVIFLAFVVDIGNQRQDRRQLTTATDAAALDVAKRWADASLEPLADFVFISDGKYDCSVDAKDYLQRNRAIDDAYECEATYLNGQLASVRVFSSGTTEYQVGKAIGVDQGGVKSTTSVRISSALGGGLRPFAICSRDPDVLLWYSAAVLAVAADQPVPEDTITVGGPKFLPPACEQNNANWGFVRFATQSSGVGNTSQDALAGTILNGTTDPLSSFDNGDLDYDEEKQVCVDDADESPQTLYDDQIPKVTCVFNDTGGGAWNNQNTENAFDELISSGLTFHLPLYGEIATIGNGQLTGFPIVAFAEVRLVGYNSGGANNNSVTLQFLNLSSGDCCDVNEGNQVLEICDVGTTSGDVLASFPTACETSANSSTPPPPLPPLPDPCTGVQLDPPAASVTLGGPGGRRLTAPLTYTLTVVDADDCGAIDVVIDNGTGSPPTAGAARIGTTDQYSATFPAGTSIGNPPAAYQVEAYEDGEAGALATAVLTAS